MANREYELEKLEVVACLAAAWLLSLIPWVTLAAYQVLGLAVVLGIWFVLGLNWKAIAGLLVGGGTAVWVCKAAADSYLETRSMAMLIFGFSVWLLMVASELKWVGLLLGPRAPTR